MATYTDNTLGLKTLELPFEWGVAGTVHLNLLNLSTRPFYIHKCVIKNGSTAGTTTAGAFDVTTPNTEYVFTFPATDAAVGEAVETTFLGAETILPGKTFSVTQKTATSAAKDGTIFLLYQGD